MLLLRLCLPALLALGVWAQDTRVVLLGTGTPNPDPDRMGPSVAVASGKGLYIVDCGPGVVHRAAQAGFSTAQMTRLFVTHLHSDHTAGYPDLILTPPNLDRKLPLEAWGPQGLRTMTEHILQAWTVDLKVRLHGMQPVTPEGFQVHAHDVKPGEIYKDENVRVIAFRVPHGDFPGAFGYRFEAKDKVIVISGDTTYSPELIAASKGADILVHEVYSEKGWGRRTPDWQKYHAAFHTSAPDVGKVAAAVQPKKLVLYHLLPMGETEAEVVGEVKRNFSGEVIWGKDLDVIR